MNAPVIAWLDEEYPVIEWLDEKTALAAHLNGACICDGDIVAGLDIHYEDSDALKRLKVRAQEALRAWSWPILYPLAVAKAKGGKS